MSPDQISACLTQAHYVPRRSEVLALAAALGPRSAAGLPAILFEGPPGTGKTAVGETLGKALGWPVLFAQLHSWSDADELFMGIDVASAVAGEASTVRQPGVLAAAAGMCASLKEGRVILILDEVDKTSEHAETLLLDFLQSGRVPVRPGSHLRIDPEKILVLLTSNGERPFREALLRRVSVVKMENLSLDTIQQIVGQQCPSIPKGVRTLVCKACSGKAVSVIIQAVTEIFHHARSAEDVAMLLEHRQVQDKKIASAIWGELRR